MDRDRQLNRDTDRYQGELMGHPPIRRQLGPEAQGGEHLVTVVVLYDLPHCLQGHGISVHLVWVHVVEGGGLGWVTWGSQEGG